MATSASLSLLASVLFLGCAHLASAAGGGAGCAGVVNAQTCIAPDGKRVCYAPGTTKSYVKGG